MQIINTSNGPAVLTDEGNVVLPSDHEGIKKVLAASPATVTDLVAALEQRIQATDPIVAKVKALESLTEDEFKALQIGSSSLANVQNVGYAVQSAAQQEGHSHE